VAELLSEWLFAGFTASTVLISIPTFQPSHPLAAGARNVGYALALLCISGMTMAVWLRGHQSRERR
jgi:hypothetical protein